MRISISSILTGLFLTASLSTLAVPAKPGLLSITQPDGTVVEAYLTGDEHGHYYETPAGEILVEGADGYLCRATIGADGNLEAVAAPTGVATPAAEAMAIRQAVSASRVTAINSLKAPRRIAPAAIPRSFPTTGEVRGLIIMAEFQDVKFSSKATRELYDRKVNERGFSDESTYGSVIDYFTEQSQGKFTPKFDVVGPVTLPHDRKWYGDGSLGMERIDDFYRDACKAADEAGVDFTQYDVNEDYFVDFVFVVFAGHGQAQGGPVESIWPVMKDLSNSVYDYFDMMNLSVAACACELKGGKGEVLDGIGTVCHEFSHILGLADIYDPSYSGAHGMAHFDIMDMGTYNDNQVTPSGYTAMDKYTLGWLEPEVLDETAKGVTLESFADTNKAYFIVNPDNTNEYFTLENRRQEGWDKGIPNHGMVISYCHYDAQHWKRNTVNSPAIAGYEHVRIVAADNVWNTEGTGEQGDPFPGSQNVTSFGPGNSAYMWQSTRKAPIFTLNNISESPEGLITFDFNSGTTAIGDITAPAESAVTVAGNDILAPEGSEAFDLSGRRVGLTSLPAGIYVVRTPSATVKVAVK